MSEDSSEETLVKKNNKKSNKDDPFDKLQLDLVAQKYYKDLKDDSNLKVVKVSCICYT